MLHDEKITKKRLGNDALWNQLECISRGTYPNYLGRGREQTHPPYTYNDQQRYKLSRQNV